MSRKLLKQMSSEWRSNLWLVVELAVVSVVLWYVADLLFIYGRTYSIGMGMDTENVFRIYTDDVPPGTPGYDPTDTTETSAEHRKVIYDRLRVHPDVEIAAITRLGVPFEMNLTSTTLRNADPNDSIAFVGSIAMRVVTPEYFELLRIHGADGESPAEVRRIFETGGELLTPDVPYCKFPHKRYESWKEVYEEYKRYDPRELVGRTFIDGDSNVVKIAGLINPIQRQPFETTLTSRICHFEKDSQAYRWGSILVRVKPGKADGFAEKILRDNETVYRSGNRYISGLETVTDIGLRTTHNAFIEVRNSIVLLVFLLVSIFLGLLGTFWFRTQQRVGEIAIRKVNGATPAQIFRRLLGEGMALLTIATIPAIAFDWLLTYMELNQCSNFAFYFEPVRFITCVVAVYLLMTLMVVAGIWFPASRAMKLDAASTLKDQ